MSFLAFEHLVSKPISFLHLTVDIFVRPSVPIIQMFLVVYRLAQCLICKVMDNLYECGESTITKYTLIICRVFSFQDKLFGRYIHAPTGHRLADTIRNFCNITGLPNVVGVIGGTHIYLSSRPQWGLTLMSYDFFQ